MRLLASFIVERKGPIPYRGESIPPNVREVLGFEEKVWKFLNRRSFFSTQEETEEITRLKELVKLCETLPTS